jgi:hypothetical protein
MNTANSWLHGFTQYLNRWAPMLRLSGQETSRRVNNPGWRDGAKWARRYAALHYFIQTGLGAELIPVEQTLQLIHRFETDPRKGRYTSRLYTMNATGVRPRLGPQVRENMSSTAPTLCEFAGSDAEAAPPLVSTMWSPGSDDLRVFFCRDRSVRMNRELAGSYARLKKRHVWIFLNGEEPSWEPGITFTPEFVDMSENRLLP